MMEGRVILGCSYRHTENFGRYEVRERQAMSTASCDSRQGTEDRGQRQRQSMEDESVASVDALSRQAVKRRRFLIDSKSFASTREDQVIASPDGRCCH